MDQLKTFLAVIKKHHFWILCGMAFVVGLVIVVLSNGKLSKAYDTKKADITRVDGLITAVTNEPDHPNNNWVEAVRKKTTEYKKKAYDGWVRLWQQQKKNIFVWPDLGKEFLGYFNFQLDDPAKPKLPRAKMEELQGYYQNYVTATILPAMAKIIDAEWNGDQNANGGAGPGRLIGGNVQNQPQAQAVDHPVVWDSSDQQNFYQAYTWDDLPSEIEIRCAQEDMWVLRALFEAIARANNGARVSTDTVVRTVQKVELGRDACTDKPLGEGANRVIHIGPAPGATGPAPGPGAPALNGPMMDRAGPPTSFGASSRDRRGGRSGRGDSSASSGGRRGRSGRFQQPFTPAPGGDAGAEGAGGPPDPVRDGRYADTKGRCLSWSQVAASSTPEYRLMPFRLVLDCDEARFQTVIAELANSVLPVEVREVRINPESADAKQGGQRPGRSPRGGVVAAGGDVSSVMHNATVEIFGLAYLVNPPDPTKLKLNESGSGDAAAPATGAAAAPGNTGTPTTGTAATATSATAGPAATSTTNGTDATTPASGTSTTTTATDAAAATAPAKTPDSTAPAPMTTGGNPMGNGASGNATPPATATPPTGTSTK